MKKALPILFVVLGVALCLVMVFLMYEIAYPLRYKSEVKSAAEKYDLPPSLICAVINVESSFKPNAISSKGAMGLMQVRPETAKSLKTSENFEKEDLFNVETNLDCGCQYLSYLLKNFSFDSAICAYNAGPTKVRSWLKNKEYSSDGVTLDQIPFKETREYLQKVKKNYAHYKTRL